MIPLVCPSCAAAYDLQDEPPGYAFTCACGAKLQRPDGAGAPAQMSKGAVTALFLSCAFFLPLAPAAGLLLGLYEGQRILRTPGLRGGGVALLALIFGALSLSAQAALWAQRLGGGL